MDEDVVYMLPEAVDTDIYTAIYMVLNGTRELFCYSDEYDDRVQQFCDYIEEEIREQRAKARTEEVKEQAFQKLEDAEKEVPQNGHALFLRCNGGGEFSVASFFLHYPYARSSGSKPCGVCG